MSDEEAGGRVFFSSIRRSLEIEDEIRLVSVGVDIGSATSHLVFSRLLLERLDSRYIVAEREVFFESDVLLTPYAADQDIDAAALGAFIARQYELAGTSPDEIDTGALILTGVAVRRRNARAIADLFSAQAGKFVSVSAGDGLEATLAAFGSGAVAISIRDTARVMNVDIGGGTSKLALCASGEIVELTAVDVGARIVAFDAAGRITRLEEAGRRFAADVGATLEVGTVPAEGVLDRMAGAMADRLLDAMRSPVPAPETAALLRLDPMRNQQPPDAVTFSGGVSEFIYGQAAGEFGDLGPRLARAVAARVEAWGPRIRRSDQGIRATVVGASQYTIQVSGSTVFVSPLEVLPLRNLPVILPDLPLDDEEIDAAAVATMVRQALRRLDLHEGDRPVAVCYRWRGSATFGRLDATVRGLMDGLSAVLAHGHPLVLVSDGDVGGLIGIHAREESRLTNPVVSIDGISLKEFDFIDIGAMLELSGAVPVVIKSLVFPTTAALGRAS